MKQVLPKLSFPLPLHIFQNHLFNMNECYLNAFSVLLKCLTWFPSTERYRLLSFGYSFARRELCSDYLLRKRKMIPIITVPNVQLFGFN